MIIYFLQLFYDMAWITKAIDENFLDVPVPPLQDRIKANMIGGIFIM